MRLISALPLIALAACGTTDRAAQNYPASGAAYVAMIDAITTVGEIESVINTSSGPIYRYQARDIVANYVKRHAEFCTADQTACFVHIESASGPQSVGFVLLKDKRRCILEETIQPAIATSDNPGTDPFLSGRVTMLPAEANAYEPMDRPVPPEPIRTAEQLQAYCSN
jgi:hypothetical protein